MIQPQGLTSDRSNRRASIRDRAMLLGMAVLLTTCGGGDDGAHSPGPLLGAPPDAAVCDGADLSGVISTVYVSPQGSEDGACGKSTASSCLKIQSGIDNCSGRGCAVLVRHGLYQTQKTITLRDGVSVFGGCRFGGEAARGYRTTIQASPAAGTPAIAGDAINTPTTVHGLVVIGKDESAAGTASIAMALSNSRGVTLTRSVLAAGRGGDGTGGSSSVQDGGPGEAGQSAANGGGGGASCPSNKAGTAGDGGHGGTDNTTKPSGRACLWQDSGTHGQDSGAVPGGALGQKGSVGLWCPQRLQDAPGDGQPGGPGAAGACGRPAQVSPLSGGSFDGIRWLPSRGEDGQAGAVGSGGGGGGAGGACCFIYGSDCYRGLHGGGGGGGGCGGGAGGGGQQGGASIPLVLVDSSPTLDPARNALVPGPGGRGGDAGNATAGGSGGAGGVGQSDGRSLYFAHWCGGTGNSGGNGGWGGAGSAGAGGHGGPSVGIALIGTSAAPASTEGIYTSLPGARGLGGTGGAAAPVSGACGGADGQWAVAGLGAAFFDFSRPSRNFLAPGETLTRGQSRTSANGTVEFTLQGDGNLCLYKSGAYQWCSLQTGHGLADTVTLQTDGFLCLAINNGLNCTFPSPPGSYLIVQDDGHAVIGNESGVAWTIP